MIVLGHFHLFRIEPVWEQAGGNKKHFIHLLAELAANEIRYDRKRSSKYCRQEPLSLNIFSSKTCFET